MNATRSSRIIAGILIPPPLGSLFACLFLIISEGMFRKIDLLPMMIFLAYVAMGLPSIGFSVVMELIVRDWKEKVIIYYGAAASLGVLSTFVLSIPAGKWFSEFTVIGALVGICTAFILYQMSTPDKTESQ